MMKMSAIVLIEGISTNVTTTTTNIARFRKKEKPPVIICDHLMIIVLEQSELKEYIR